MSSDLDLFPRSVWTGEKHLWTTETNDDRDRNKQEQLMKKDEQSSSVYNELKLQSQSIENIECWRESRREESISKQSRETFYIPCFTMNIPAIGIDDLYSKCISYIHNSNESMNP